MFALALLSLLVADIEYAGATSGCSELLHVHISCVHGSPLPTHKCKMFSFAALIAGINCAMCMEEKEARMKCS